MDGSDCLLTELIHTRIVDGIEQSFLSFMTLSKMLQTLNFKEDESIDSHKYEDFGVKVKERVRTTHQGGMFMSYDQIKKFDLLWGKKPENNSEEKQDAS